MGVLITRVCSAAMICILSPFASFGQTAPQPVSLVEAAHSALANHPGLKIQEEQVELSRAQRRQATAAFDEVTGGTVGHSRTYSPYTTPEKVAALAAGLPASALLTNQTTLSVSANQLLRNGISVGPLFDMTRVADNFNRVAGANFSRLAFGVTLPLLRGRGTAVTTANERAAEVEVDATGLDLRQVTSQLLLNVVSSYWNLVGARKALEVASGSEERGRTILSNTRSLIEADRQPRSDENNVMANLADREATRLAAQQQVISAQQQLSLDMGAPADQFTASWAPTDVFPEPSIALGTQIAALDLDRVIGGALSERSDYLAAAQRVNEARILRDAARNQLLPQLDVSVSSGYSGLSEGRQLSAFFSGAAANVRGADVVGGITYQFPPRNNLARGRFAEAEARLRQAEYNMRDVARAISASVVNSLNGVRIAAVRVERARASVNSFQEALQGERDRLSLGTGSIVDILTVEDRLTAALNSEVQAQLGFAQALIQFRFATGTLIPPRDAMPVVDLGLLTALPDSVPGVRN